MRATSYADIDPQEPDWLIPGWIQLGGVTYIAGLGGVGKSFLTADWAARITRGDRMPGDDQDPLPVGSVILVSSEDDPHMSMAYRLRAAGADLSRVYDMTDDFTIPEGLAGLREDVAELGDTRLVVIDPLAANLGYVPNTRRQLSLTSGNATIRRNVSMPLERFARSTGVALVVIHHRVKSGSTAGSKAITDAARQVLSVTRSAQDERIRVIEVEKSNIASDSSGALAYTLAGSGLDTHVEYLVVPDGATDAPRRAPSTIERIVIALAEGPLETQELARKAGLDYQQTRTALTRGKRDGAVVSPKRGVWALPGPGDVPSDSPFIELVRP